MAARPSLACGPAAPAAVHASYQYDTLIQDEPVRIGQDGCGDHTQ
jgi:hypothetical protein